MVQEEDKAERACPMCAEPLRREAVVCPYCRARLNRSPPFDLHRNRAGRKIGGVCTALAEHLGVSVTLVRLGFVLACLYHLLGAAVYAAFWLMMPAERTSDSPLGRWLSKLGAKSSDGRSVLDDVLDRCRSHLSRLRSAFGARPNGGPAAGTGADKPSDPGIA